MSRLPSYHLTSPSEHQLSIECSNGRSLVSSDYSEVLQFLVGSSPGSPLPVPRVVWNLSELVSQIRAILPSFVLEEFDSDTPRATWEDSRCRYRLYYQPGKFLGIHAGSFGDETTFYELDQFFPEHHEPGSVAEVQTLANLLVDAFGALGVYRIDNLKSPVAVIEASGILDRLYKGLPSPAKIPPDCLEYATLCDTYGAWSAAYQLGYWPEGEAYSYDIGSCYPSIARGLVSLEGAGYRFIKSMPEATVNGGLHYGFLRGTIIINPDHPFAFCSPIVAAVDDIVTNPVGAFSGYFTLGQVRFLERHGLGTFRLQDGWLVELHSEERPLQKVMDDLYRQRAKGELVNMIAKRVIAGIIGRLGEYHQDVPTEYTNPIYHSIIRGYAPLKVGGFLIEHGLTPEELILVNTDGFHATRRIELPPDSGMGKWRSEGSEALIVLSSDRLLAGDKCEPLLAAIKADPKAPGYSLESGEVSLLSLAADQDRHFPKVPLSGRDLLRTKYPSQPLIAGNHGQ